MATVSQALGPSAPRNQGYRLEGADPPVQAVPPFVELWQTPTTRVGRDRARTGGLHLGHRTKDTAARVIDTRKLPVQHAGDGSSQ